MEYKISKFQWFNEIPSHWKESKISYLFEIGRGRVISGPELKEDGLYPVYSSQTKNDGCMGMIDTYDFDDHLITWTTDGANAGTIFIRSGKFNCTNVCGTLKPVVDADLKYYYYYLQFVTQFYKRPDTNGAKIMNNEMASVHALIPPVSEQTKIAHYLDQKTAQIDTIIEKKQKLLQLLDEKKKAVINEAVTKGLNPNVPKKDSGIEWIGDIPESWQVTKIKYCSALQGRIGFKGYSKDDIVTADEGALTLGAKHINKKNELDLYSPEYLSWEKYFESPEIMVNVGDIIFTQRGSLGKVCIIEHNIGEATINPSMVILRTYPNINSKFLYNWLTADYIQNNVNLIQSNTAVPMISQFQLGNFEVLAPSLKEQEEINEFIESYKEGSNVLSKKVLIQIEKLIEYRQSLISEAVTGKIVVSN